MAEGGFDEQTLRSTSVSAHIARAEAQQGDIWYGTAELERQLAMLDDSIDIQGEVYFSYSSLEAVAGARPC